MFAGRLVPWLHWREWQDAKSCLFSSDDAACRSGIHKVEAWRVRGRVPLAVDCTASLRETQILDREEELSDQVIRSQYCLSLLRLVNGISDSSQRGKTANSVASLATAAGVPRFLVDMRHEATHNELPSLEAAREGAAAALSWLEACYWQRQEEHLATSSGKLKDLVLTLMASGEESQGHRSSDSPSTQKSGKVASSPKRPGVKTQTAALSAVRSFVGRTSAPDLADVVWSILAENRGQPRALVLELLCTLREEWPALGGLLVRSMLADGLEIAQAAFEENAWHAFLAETLGACCLSSQQAKDILQRGALTDCSTVWTQRLPQRGHYLELCRALRRALHAEGDQAWVDGALEALQTESEQGGDSNRNNNKITSNPVDDIDFLLAEAEALIQREEEAKEERSADTDCGGPRQTGANSSLQEDENELDQPRKRWRRSDPVDWVPCALGMLPSCLDANGVPPDLRLADEAR